MGRLVSHGRGMKSLKGQRRIEESKEPEERARKTGLREDWKAEKTEDVCTGRYGGHCVREAYAEWSLE